MLYPRDIIHFAYYTGDDYNNYKAIDIAGHRAVITMFILYVWETIYIAGIGNMIADAIKNGTTSAKSFLFGLKKYMIRVLLFSLLLFIIYIGIAIEIWFLSLPIVDIWSTFRRYIVNTFPFLVPVIIRLSVPIFQSILVIFTVPFMILWLPSIFVDNISVRKGLLIGFSLI